MATTFLILELLLLLLQISLVLGFSSHVGNITVKCKDRERQALLALKHDLIDDFDMLFSWGNGEEQKECCKWDYVQCSNRTGHVVRLDLQGLFPFPLLFSWKYSNLHGGKIPLELGSLSRLQYLDLSSNSLTGEIPRQLGNLPSLQHLDLSGNYFTGTIPHDLGNLTHLQYLDFSPSPSGHGVHNLSSDLEWLPHISSLKILNLSNVDLSSANNWPEQVSNLFQLEELTLSDCNLFSAASSFYSITTNMSSYSLAAIDLSLNNLTFSIIPWLLSYTYSLALLDLSGNCLSGPISEDFANFISLEELNLGDNLLEGEIPRYLGELCSLQTLILRGNNLTGLQAFVSSSTGHRCGLKSIHYLDLAMNQFTGSFPNVSQFSSLQSLDLSHNHLNGTLSESVSQLSNLEVLTISYNSLQGVISQVHFSKLSKLLALDLSHNALVFDTTDDWDPPFYLQFLNLKSCRLVPSFPRWLQTQAKLIWLDISNNEISENVPAWFWNYSRRLSYLNLSHNFIRGEIENLSLTSNPIHTKMDLSSNMFEGSIPAFLSSARILDLSNNKFTNASSLLCAENAEELCILDISNNQLSGEFPKCQMHLESLIILDLRNNNLRGNIPKSVGLLTHIQSLHLGNNNFTGELPSSLHNCTNLRVLDVIQNSLSGPIPTWIGDELQKLVVLSLRSNQFRGTLPPSICHLTQLQILDLSLNDISGTMPACLGNLTALATQYATDPTITSTFYGKIFVYTVVTVYIDDASIMWKGNEAKYRNTLGLVRSIDLSSNKLFGEIPSEVMNLVGLISFNISRNNLSGGIPAEIGQLKLLDFLDMSRNHFSGKIPSQLSQIDRLSVLDLSHNNLSDEIPLGTQLQSFDSSAYEGNPELCGPPLLRKCTEMKQRNYNRKDEEDGESFLTRGFYSCMAVGFVLGFWGVCGSLIFNKSWRYAYYRFLNNIYNKLYVLTAISMAILQRFKSST